MSVSVTRFFLFLLFVAVTINLLFCTVLRIPQEGMFPGIKPGGFIIVKLRPYKDIKEVRRGDVVVFNHIEDNQQGARYVWRVVAMPGETVSMDGDAISIDGKPLRHEELRKEGRDVIFRETNNGISYEVSYESDAEHPKLPLKKTVPKGQFFVLGDNRFDARDSTYIGPIPFENIVAKKLY